MKAKQTQTHIKVKEGLRYHLQQPTLLHVDIVLFLAK